MFTHKYLFVSRVNLAMILVRIKNSSNHCLTARFSKQDFVFSLKTVRCRSINDSAVTCDIALPTPEISQTITLLYDGNISGSDGHAGFM